mgnify:CR=1 FL=1
MLFFFFGREYEDGGDVLVKRCYCSMLVLIYQLKVDNEYDNA